MLGAKESPESADLPLPGTVLDSQNLRCQRTELVNYFPLQQAFDVDD